jgi:hypothetical protein
VAHARVLIAALLAFASACGDGGQNAPPRAAVTATSAATPTPPAEGAAPISFSEEPVALPRFASKRFHVSIPLPDGKQWKIDDHSRAELFALHEPTRSKLHVIVFSDPELMSRQKCEERAREKKMVPAGDLRTVEDAVTVGPEAFDTRLWVAVQTGKKEGDPLVGHVFAFGGFLRKCLVFHFSSEVPSAKHELVLSSRLAIARTRVFGGLQIDALADVTREKPR